jgi:hypothetical protein
MSAQEQDILHCADTSRAYLQVVALKRVYVRDACCQPVWVHRPIAHTPAEWVRTANQTDSGVR